jgi:UDP-2,4-diacetamido-2,4,6-trideoxy-beta-L-altropyranose hydrolase
MAELMLGADLGIGAGGGAMWERCCLGLPTITVVFAANQERTTEDVANIGAIEYLGWSDQLTSEDYARAIVGLIENSQRVRNISNAALGVLQAKSTFLVNAMYRLARENESFCFSNRAISSRTVL